MNQELRDFLVAKLVDTGLSSPDRTKAVEIALVATGIKPAWMWESIDPDGAPCPEPAPVAAEFSTALERAGWAVRHTHLYSPVLLGPVGALMRPIMGSHYPAIHFDAVVAAPGEAAADRLLAAYRESRSKQSRAGEINLGAALGYPPHATRHPGVPRLTELDLRQAPGAGDLWICGFVDDEIGRAEAAAWLSMWAHVMSVEFPGLWPLAPLTDEGEDPHQDHEPCPEHSH